MFENSEKLLFFLVIALLFLGPQKMAGLGTTLGRAIRDFRSTVRGAQETFHQEFSSAAQELSSPAMEPPPALLPAPESAAAASHDAVPAPESARETPGTRAEMGSPAPDAVEVDDQSSLASEPTAQALAEQRARAGRESGR
jgi:Sec-independent protein translocase protein TatA